MMKYLALLFSFIGLFSFAQEMQKDRGNVHVHFGTVIVYSTYSLGYEGFDLLKNVSNHQVRPLVRVGGWNSSILNKNSGSMASIGVSYLFGKKNHFLEHSSELVSHFDQGLKGQSIAYVGSLYRPYLGYRYQPEGKKIILKIGSGWREVLQVGFGYRL